MGKRINIGFILLIPFLIFIGCHRKIVLAKTGTNNPNYSSLQSWAAHPFKHDLSDSTPLPLRPTHVDSNIDVFFIHPTTFTKKALQYDRNADINDMGLNNKTDKSAILYQASIFNEYRVFAPRYRQAHYQNFFSNDTVKAKRAFDLAYEDLKNAFEEYLKTWNGGRPIILAGHSQGSMMAIRLLQDYFDDKPLSKRLVAAYIPGWAIYPNTFKKISMCKDSVMTGCVCSWRTMENGYVPSYIRKVKQTALVTNPLSWDMNDTYVNATMNKGSIFRNFDKLYLHSTGAQISKGVLWIHKPRFPYSFLYISKNFHIGDFNIFYMNVREDAKRRVGLFWKK